MTRLKTSHAPPALALALCALLVPVGSGCSSDAEASESPPEADVAAAQQPGDDAAVEETPTYDPRNSLAPLIKAVGPAVVSIRASGHREVAGFFGSSREPIQGAGSGFVIAETGVVVTNHHVIDNAEQLEVSLHDGRKFSARVVGSDPETDLAVLQLEGAKDLPVSQFAQSEELEVGDWVVAIGNPMGLTHSASVGIISGRGRGSLGLYPNSYLDFLQTDADIAPGSSGGPLFDLNGQVVGITTAVGAGNGQGFAIPSSQAQHVIAQLRDRGHVVRGWLGAGNEPDTDSEGAVIGQVFEGTPAAESGLQRGDVIAKVDGKTVESFDALRRAIARTEPGHTVLMEVDRDGETLELTAVIKSRPDSNELSGLRRQRFPSKSVSPGPRTSAPTAPPTAGIGQRLGVQARGTPEGLGVVRVEPNGLAADLDLQAGDVLTSLNGEPVREPADVGAALRRSRDRVDVEFLRDGVKHNVSLERS